MTALHAEALTKSYPTPGNQRLDVLRGVSLDLQSGENLAILGPSGSGKSTLLAILGTLDEPTTGTLQIGVVNPFTLSEGPLADFRNRHIGFVFQDHHLLPQCTVLENVLIPFVAQGAARQAEIDSARRLIERVGLAERESHRPAQLSGGERQRVAIARALVRQPLLVLADEPTGNLDRTTAEEISKLLLELQQETRSTLVVVTHSTTLAAGLQRRLVLDAGRLVEE
jgi:lipoprotein-releasing system ATP-binding protein